MMTRSVIILSCCLLVSCSRGTNPIVISSEFEPWQIEAIEAAAERWFEAIPEVRTDVSVSDDSPNIYPTYVSWGENKLGGSKDGRYVKLYMPLLNDEELFGKVVLHELGHYLGAHGHTESGSLMDAWLDDAADCIAREDIELVCNGRRGGCRDYGTPEC